MRSFLALILSLFLFNQFLPGVALAEEEHSNSALEKRIEALEAEVKILKRQLEVKKEDEVKKVEEAPVITASPKDGFSIKSADESFRLKIRGYVQADGRFFTDNKKDIGTTDTILLRRARPIVEGTVFNDFDYIFVPSFDAGVAAVQDAAVEYKYFPKARIKVGKFKVPVGLERLQSDVNNSFVELGYPTALVPNRDMGAQVSGDIWDGSLSYAVGVFNGTADGASVDTDNNNEKEIAARLFARPFQSTDIAPLQGLGAGIAATYGHQEGATLPTYRSPGQAAIFNYVSGVSADGPHARLSPQFYYHWDSFGLLGEYVVSEQTVVKTVSGSILRDKISNDAWQLVASYVLTGEDASFKGVDPRKPFSVKDHTWGAFEMVGRYGVLDIDNIAFSDALANPNASVSEAESWGLGLNWYLNRNLKLMLDYERTDFTGGSALEDRETENTIFSRVQASY